MAAKAINIPVLDIKMLGAIRKFRPDVLVGFASVRNAHVSRLIGKPAIAFEDSEPARLGQMLYVPFTDAVLTPSCFRKDFGRKHIRYDGYVELAYLHPNVFRPDPSVLDTIGVGRDEPYTIMRFVGWKAGHDIGRGGFDLDTKVRAVKELEKYGRVFLSSELPLPPELEPYRLTAPPGQIHHLLNYAQMLVCDSGTMTTEAALLGTPVVRCDSIVAAQDYGNFAELENRYRLICNVATPRKALAKAIELVARPRLKDEWRARRETMLRDKIDVNAFMVRFVEQYPESLEACRGLEVPECLTGSSS